MVYYARNNPLDRFYAANLSTFLAKPLDDLVANAENEDIIKNHLPALLYETPDFPGTVEMLGPALYEAVADKVATGARPVRSGQYRPHFSIPIRGAGAGNFTLKDGSREIGTLSGSTAVSRGISACHLYAWGSHLPRTRDLANGQRG